MPAVLSKPATAGMSQRQRLGTAAVMAVVSILVYVHRLNQKSKRHHLRRKSSFDSAVLRKDGQKEIWVPYKNGMSKVVIRPTKPETIEANKKLFEKPVPPAKKVAVNNEFYRQLGAIFHIIVPHLQSKEVGLFALNTVFLVLRTWLSVVVAKLDGRIVRDLVDANGKEFLVGIAYWFLIAIPATYTNSMIKFFQSKLSIAFRTRLTRYVHDLYLDDKMTYYKALNLDNSIEAADQYITTDIARFCDTLASLYSNLAKPLLDVVIFNYQLANSIGVAGMGGLFINYMITARLLRAVTPAFGKLAAIEAKLEGDFRAAHSRLIINAEEIAFYNGQHLEKSILASSYTRLIKHINSIFKIRIAYNMFEDFIIKYLWSAIGMSLCSVPVFFPSWAGLGGVLEAAGVTTGDKEADLARENDNRERDRTGAFITNRRIMLSLADAGGRIMYSYKEMAELAGYTSRVYNLLSTLHRLHDSKYKTVDPPADFKDGTWYDLGHIKGRTVLGQDVVEFSNVPIVTPGAGVKGGEELVKGLDVRVEPGEHLLITGPNGVGKTGVARVISGLWPIFAGTLARPSPGDIFYIPQRPYLSLGTLRDQIIYPHSHADMEAAGRSDEELLEILKIVHLAYIPDREGGMETKKEWKDVFSGGEKQRVGMARLFYHKPEFAILDECTSAVSTDVEGLMYQHAKDMGITLITISHRPTLFKYHDHLLRLTGEHGQWELTKIGTEAERMTLNNEIKSLQEKLRHVDAWTQRAEEIKKELELGV